MKTFRDFFYDKNDILVAVLIVALAGLLVFVKIDKIMAYPNVDEVIVKKTPEDKRTTTDSGNDNGNNNATNTGEKKYPFSLYINSGESAESIGESLVTLGLFESTGDFINKINKKGVAEKIQYGTFQIPQDSTEDEVLKIITSPPNGAQ